MKPTPDSEQPTLVSASLPALGGTAVPLAGRTFGDYEVLGEVGRGGMGVVYRARQRRLNREVALKMILPGTLANADELRRFQTEAESTARLQHPNIVTVHEVGETDGCPFYSMDYIDGSSLAGRLKDGPLPGRTAARYLETVARAIGHAHRHGVLHRDLKPGNILLDRDDRPHVTDFGLAKRLDNDSKQTRTGAVLGTPSYMPPEQASGRAKDVGPASDVYALGAVLYEMLTGRPPFQGETPLDTVMQVMERDPVPPSLLNPKVDRDLETICLKCLEKPIPARYPSAEALADDLKRFLDGDSIQATEVNVFEHLARTLERSQYMGEFGTWSHMVFWFAAIVAVTHLSLFLVAVLALPPWTIWVGRLAQNLLLVVIFWFHRSRRLLPSSTAERQLWAIWVGYLLASIVLTLAGRLLNDESDPYQLKYFVPWSLLAGLALFSMGGSYWGKCYTLGAMFFVVAGVIPLWLEVAPLLFGAAWAIALVAMGYHLRQLALASGAA